MAKSVFKFPNRDNYKAMYFNGWVKNVASSGILYYNGSDRTTGTSAIPSGWTVQPF